METRWPWKVASTHVHFMRKEASVPTFLCCRSKVVRPLGELSGGDDLLAAMCCGLPVCKRCTRDLPKDARSEVLRLLECAGL